MPERRSDFALSAAIREPGFSPRRSDIPQLLSLLSGDEAEALLAERALARLGETVQGPVLASFREATPPARGRLCRLIGRLAQRDPESELASELVKNLGDADAKTRRNAIIALGKLGPAIALDPLLSAWDSEPRLDHRRSIADALGKIGDQRALERLRRDTSSDRELSRIKQAAMLKIERTHSRDSAGEIGKNVAFPFPVTVRFRCRRGIAPILCEEVGAPSPAPSSSGSGFVEITSSGPLEQLQRSRTALSFGLLLPFDDDPAESLQDRVVHALTSAQATALLGALTRGDVRYRLEWASGGHRRALTWRVAEAVAKRRPELVNDPSRAAWHVVIEERPKRIQLELVPHGLGDTRFDYRKIMPPAASHPTLAAALARIAGAVDDDVVWDPFVGSGTELIERALLGRYAALYGSDADARALEAAHANLRAAKVKAELMLGDARRVRPPVRPTLVITNPPMGRRLLSRTGVDEIFRGFVAHVAGVLRAGGRFVWISPLPEKTLRYAKAAGLVPKLRRTVDMGGFDAQIQVFVRGGRG